MPLSTSGDGVVVEAVLVHEPVGAHSIGRTTEVVHEHLLHADGGVVVHDGAILHHGLPEPGPRRLVQPKTVGVLSVPWSEQVPLHSRPLGAGVVSAL